METIQLKKLICNDYNLDVNNLKKLNGYDTENFLVHCKDESNYILKKYPFSNENLSLVKAETFLATSIRRAKCSLALRGIL